MYTTVSSKRDEENFEKVLQVQNDRTFASSFSDEFRQISRIPVMKNEEDLKKVLETQSKFEQDARTGLFSQFSKDVLETKSISNMVLHPPARWDPARLPLTYLEPTLEVVRNYHKSSQKRLPVNPLGNLESKKSKSEAPKDFKWVPPGSSKAEEEVFVSREKMEDIKKSKVVDDICDLAMHFRSKSSVWLLYQQNFDDETTRLMHFKVWLWPKNASTAEKHLCIIKRLVKDLKSLGETGYDWTPGKILNLFMYRSLEKNAEASTFTSILKTLAFFQKILGLGEEVTKPDDFVLRKYAMTFLDRNAQLVSRAEPIHPDFLARLEKIVVSGYDFFRPSEKVSFVTQVWAWNIRLLAGAGIRWSDAQYTHPSTIQIFAEGLMAWGKKTKTRSRQEGNPWSCASLGLSSPGWLEKGLDLFKTLPQHNDRDFWMCLDHEDGNSFVFRDCDFKRATFHVRRLLLMVGVPLETIANFRPHSLKSSLLSPAIHQSFENNGNLSSTEIALLGNWTTKTCQQMSLTYLRNKQIARFKSGVKVWERVLDADLLCKNQDHFDENLKRGFRSMLQKHGTEKSVAERAFLQSHNEENESDRESSAKENLPGLNTEKPDVLTEANENFVSSGPGTDAMAVEVNDLGPIDYSVVCKAKSITSNPSGKEEPTSFSSNFRINTPSSRSHTEPERGLWLSKTSEIVSYHTRTRRNKMFHVSPKGQYNVCKVGEKFFDVTQVPNYYHVCGKCYESLPENLVRSAMHETSGSRFFPVKK